MTPRRPSQPADDRGPALADALLETCRLLPALPPAAHARVKRRLTKGLARWTNRRARWLKPAVVTPVLLLCGAAFGVALDRIVLTRSSSARSETTTAVAPAGRRSRAGRAASPRAPSAAQPLPVVQSPDVAVQAPQSPPAALAATLGKPAPARAPNRRLAMPSHSLSADQAWSFPQAEPPLAPPPALPPQTVPPPIAVPLLAPTPTEILAPRPAAAASQPSPPQELSEERLLAAAVRALRSQNDARSALAALDEYRMRYSQGRLSVEASALRASALVALDRRDEALRVLDGLDLAHVPGGFERQLQRGELRASVGRHQDATADFDAVLARVDHGDLAERALWRRAQSRLQGGDRAGARRDAALYLQRHPSGQFAAPAVRLLELSP